jgi:hypothetical protein
MASLLGGGVGLVYIGRWNEPKPSDKTDLDNGEDANPKAVEEPT